MSKKIGIAVLLVCGAISGFAGNAWADAAKDKAQKLTDKYIKTIDDALAQKEQEIAS